MANNVQINEGTSGKYAKTTEVTADVHLGNTMLCDSTGAEITEFPITDNGGSITVDGEVAVTGALTDGELRATPVPVSGTVAVTNAGITSLDGKVTACNTGAVVVSSSALPTGAATSSKQDTLDISVNTLLKPASTLAAVTTLGTITNVVHVDDNSGSITVDGPVTDAQLRASAVPVSIASMPSTPVTGTFYQATQPVSIASAVPITDNSGSLTVDNAGTFAVQATLAAETTKVIGTVNVAGSQTIAVTNATAANLKAEIVGTGTLAVQNTDSITAATKLSIKAAYTASQTASVVLTPTSGKKVVITHIVISATSAGTVYLFDNTDTSTTCIGATLNLSATGGWESTFGNSPFVSAAANNVIKYTSGAGAAGSIWIQYYEV